MPQIRNKLSRHLSQSGIIGSEKVNVEGLNVLGCREVGERLTWWLMNNVWLRRSCPKAVFERQYC